MPGKWGGVRWAHLPRSASEKLGCQANGGARAGRAPPLDPPMVIKHYSGLQLDHKESNDLANVLSYLCLGRWSWRRQGSFFLSQDIRAQICAKPWEFLLFSEVETR